MNNIQASGKSARELDSRRLPRAASRLLRVLAEPDAYALEDPTQDGFVVVRSGGAGVSLGGGRFPAAAAEALVRRDLAQIRVTASGRRVFELSAAGTAHGRRASAGEVEDAFLEQHQDLVTAQVEVGGIPSNVRRDASESPLEWLRRRKDRSGEPLVDAAAFEAGERLRRDLTLAQMLPSVTANWNAAAVKGPAGPGGPANATDTAVAARQRASKALDVVGPDFAGLLLDLCGFLKGLEQIEQERGWPPRSAKVVVKLALARLADHYGLARSARGPAESRGIRAWRAVLLDCRVSGG